MTGRCGRLRPTSCQPADRNRNLCIDREAEALVRQAERSLDLMRVIFAKQTMQGKGPGAAASAAA